jgi:hypothetical protein
MAEKETWEDTRRLLDELDADIKSAPPKPTHPGNKTLHRGKKATTNFKKGGMVKGQNRDYCK